MPKKKGSSGKSKSTKKTTRKITKAPGRTTNKKPIKKASQHPTSRLTKAEQISRIPIETVSRLSGNVGMKELRVYVNTLRNGYRRRSASFEREGLVSHAAISLEESITSDRKPTKSMTRNQLLLEFARYAKFFNDVTSTKAGIRKVNKEQDARIFGADKRGRPLRRMTNEERKRYWSVYDEYNSLHPTGISTLSSEAIQQAIGRIVGGDEEFLDTPFMDILNAVHDALEEEYASRIDKVRPNVYRGRGDN